MDVLEAEARAGKTVIASTHDLICAAQRFHEAAFINGRVVATGPGRAGPRPAAPVRDVRRPRPHPARRRRPARPRRRPPPRRGARRRAPLPRRRALMDPSASSPTRWPTASCSAASSRRSWSASSARSWARSSCSRASRSSATRSATPRSRASSSRSSLGLPLYLGGAVAAVGDRARHRLVSRRSRLRFDTAVGVLFAGTFALRRPALLARSRATRGPARLPARQRPRHRRRRPDPGRDPRRRSCWRSSS